MAFYGEDEADNSYRESPELVAVKSEPEAQSKPTESSQPQEQVVSAAMEKQPRPDNVVTVAESKVEPEVEKEPPLAENMGELNSGLCPGAPLTNFNDGGPGVGGGGGPSEFFGS